MANYYELLGINQKELEKTFNEEEISAQIEKNYQIKLKRITSEQQDIKGKLKEALQEAYETLIDEEKRKKYDELLKEEEKQKSQASLKIHSSDTKKEDLAPKSFVALAPVEDIKAEFDKFVKEKTGDINAEGYSATIMPDSKTGSKTLVLNFPNNEAADEFIKRMLNQNMAKLTEQVLSEKKESPVEPSPFQKKPNPFKK